MSGNSEKWPQIVVYSEKCPAGIFRMIFNYPVEFRNRRVFFGRTTWLWNLSVKCNVKN